MKSIKKLLKRFLQPWTTIVYARISSVAKAVIVGCTASLALGAVGWTLFSSSAELEKRSFISVLVSPDYRFIEVKPEEWLPDGTCSTLSISEPNEGYFANPGGAFLGKSESDMCRDWKRDESYEDSFGNKRWIATKLRRVVSSGEYAYSVGSSRSEALEHAKDVWVNVFRSLLLPLVILFIMQIGVLVGYQYFRKSSGPRTRDE